MTHNEKYLKENQLKYKFSSTSRFSRRSLLDIGK